MTYGSKQYKNGKIVGYLIFDSGKRVFLNEKEKKEFEIKIDYWMEYQRKSKKLN